MSKPRSVVVMSQTPINIFVLFDFVEDISVQYEYVTISWSRRLISVISQGTDIHVLILCAMCVLKIYTKRIIYVCWKIDMSLLASFFVLLEEPEEHTSDHVRSLRNNVAGCGDQKHLPRGVHWFSRPCMDVVGRKAIYEVVLRWVAQKLCRRFGYRITYFCYFSYPFSKLPILGMARQVGGEDAQVFDHFRRQVSEPVGKPGRNYGETKNGKQGRKKKKHIPSFDRRISDLAVLMV